MGKWVVCHTRSGTIHGRLFDCNSTYLFLQTPLYGTISGDGNETPQTVHGVGNDSNDITNVYYGGYGYGGYGRTAVALASVVGLTAIGLSAMWW